MPGELGYTSYFPSGGSEDELARAFVALALALTAGPVEATAAREDVPAGRGRRVALVALVVAAAGAVAPAATPFLPWGAVTGASIRYGPDGAPSGTGFTAAFDIAGGPGPLLWLLGAGLVLAVLFARPKPPTVGLLALAATCVAVLAVLVPFRGDEETFGSDGLNVATAGVALCFAGLVATAATARR